MAWLSKTFGNWAEEFKLTESLSIKTIFCDIDGVIFRHFRYIDEIVSMNVQTSVLPGVKEKFREWLSMGHMIILITGRPPSMREVTERQLKEAGIVYYDLIMGLPRGQRIIVNDKKPHSEISTVGVCELERDEGLINVEW